MSHLLMSELHVSARPVLVVSSRLLALIFVLSTCAGGQTSSAPDAIGKSIEKEMAKSKVPGAAVVVVKNGQVVYSRGFGKASVAQSTPVTTSTVFRLGSTTKMMTSAALLELVARGKLDLDTAVTKYVTGLDEGFNKTTLRRSLSHSAGLCEASPEVVSNDDDALAKEVAGWKGKQRFFAEAGAIFSYSGPSYYLSGHVLERTTGKPFADAISESLFKPLGMKSSTLRPLVALTFPLAQGHTAGKKGVEVVRPMAENVAMYPGGSVFSTADDVGKFMIALLDGSDVGFSKGAEELFFSPQITLPAPERLKDNYQYAFGTVTYKLGGVQVFEHGGVRKGYGSFIRMIPSKRIGIAIMTNLNGATLRSSLAALTKQFAGLEEEPEKEPAKVPVDSNEAAAIAGSYEQCGFKWTFTAASGGLVQEFEGTRIELSRIGPLDYAGPNGEEVLFIRGKSGAIEFMHQDLVGARKSTVSAK